MLKEKKMHPNFKVSLIQKLFHKSYPVNNTPQAYFPYEPYPQQSELVRSIQQTISSSQNAIIQSPTGTGKTLCLLVGSLSALNTINSQRTKIFYLTRTHSQISQVINQFKKTLYQAKINIIASRDHLCVNPNTKQVKGRVLQKVCGDFIQQKSCLFHESEERKIYVNKREVLQLEDFKETCRKELVCPFFYSKELTEKTQLTILPFNYFLDWKIFQSFSYLIKDSVIIFDEAHNVDSIAEDGACLQIDCRALGYTINELKGLEKKFKFESQVNTKNKNEIKVVYSIFERLKNSIQETKKRVFCSKAELEEFMSLSTQIVDPQNTTELIEGLDLNDSMSFFQNLHQVTKLFYKKQVQPVSFLGLVSSLEKICMLWKQKSFEKDFITKIASDEDEKSFCLRLKCLSPSVGFHKLMEQNPRSIILSSGTMGNLQKWERYLHIDFHKKLKISSFITTRQLYCSIVGRSQSNYPFEFSYQKKDYENQHREVAEELMKVEATVPDGNGIVVAFSTYLLMEKVIKHCGGLRKRVFYESKGGDVSKIFSQYSQCAKHKGAFLFIVMKGRFSQGINFSDQLCRCLVVVGIPFLPRKQPGIEEKMSYIKETYSNQQSQEWYKEQSFQSVNQTIGRVIRSKSDYGVILLLDQRYSKRENLQLLSGWFRKCIRMTKIEELYKDVKAFFHKKEWLEETQPKSKQQQVKREVLNQRNQSVKTVNKKKRHLKLRLQSSSKKSSQSGNHSKSFDKSQTKIKNSSIQKSQEKLNNKKKLLKDEESMFKTPVHKNKFFDNNSSSLLFSKINIDKKQKLKGFVNKKMSNLSITTNQSNNTASKGENKEEILVDSIEQLKTVEKTSEKNKKQELKNKSFLDVGPFLEFFMM